MTTDSTVREIPADALLATRIREGDPAAEEELVKTYRRPVLVIALARTRDRDTANDLSQEILIAVLKALRGGQIRDGEKLGAFIQGTARNIINNHLRSRSRHPEVDIDGIDIPAGDPIDQMESSERQRLMREELANYSITDQKILLLSLVDGHSLAEVATRLGMSHDAVRARKSRLIRKITKKFQGMSQK
ncbi:MAG TPA: sigma-70 family RNA polymerase sigma factor [Dongiaceae bacterium]|nr:sigma-70 family RNA polymerase sigma factor [Dongiaceae bacterium]